MTQTVLQQETQKLRKIVSPELVSLLVLSVGLIALFSV